MELTGCIANITWEQAQAVCRRAEGGLVLPDTADKVTKLAGLVSYVQLMSLEQRQYFGLPQYGSFGLWVDGNAENITGSGLLQESNAELNAWCPLATANDAASGIATRGACTIADTDSCNHGCANRTRGEDVLGFVCEMPTTCAMWNITENCRDPPFGMEFCRDFVHEGAPVFCISPGDGGLKPTHCNARHEVGGAGGSGGGLAAWQAATIGVCAATAICTTLVVLAVWLKRRRNRRRRLEAGKAVTNGLAAMAAAEKPPGPPDSTIPHTEVEGGKIWRDERAMALMPAAPPVGARDNLVGEERPSGLPVVPSETIRPPCVPVYWSTSTGVELLQDWNRVGSIQKLMDATWKAKFTRDRVLRAGQDRVPVGCRLLNVIRVENHGAWARYQDYKEALRSRRGENLEEWAAATSGHFEGTDMDSDVNETYLFHGTSPSAAQEIIRSEFSLGKAGSHGGTMFGDGIYLAENASKSDEYAQEGQGVYHGLCAVLICRAALGRVGTVEEPGDHTGLVRSGEYDSLCGDRVGVAGTFRELVLFSQEAVYPEFIANYARTFEGEFL